MTAAERDLDALIVGNIGDLEASMKRAKESIDERLNTASWEELKRALGDDNWYYEDGDDLGDAWFAPRAWLIEDEEGDFDADPWFRLKPIDAKREFDSWLAHYVAPKNNRQQIAVVWCWHRFYVNDYKAAVDEVEDQITAITDLGFHRDGRELFLPLSFDTDALVEGFQVGDLTEALEPIADGANVLKNALSHFSAFRTELLAKAR